MLDHVYWAHIGWEEPLVEEFCFPFGFSYWVVVAVAHGWEKVSASSFAYLSHAPDISGIFRLVQAVMCPFLLCFHKGHAEGFSGLLSVDPISGIVGCYMGSGAFFGPPRGSPWVRGMFRFKGHFACFFDGTVKVFMGIAVI